MKRLMTWAVALCLCIPFSLVAEEQQEKEKQGIFSTGNIAETWSRMSTVEKCFAAIVIPPGYVVGVCFKSIAWLFMGQREF